MRIYFSGIGGVGLGPLAMIAQDAGYDAIGSDREAGLMTDHLAEREIKVSFDQSGANLKAEHEQAKIDWLIHTAGLSADHPELLMAKQLGIKTGKRDELLAHIIKDKNLQLIAVAGTHGKTTTTGMLIWAAKQLGIPASYSVGSTISFGPSGKFDPASQIFIYECDEFDRNFLHFWPQTSLITSVDYDHPDTYPTKQDYLAAFRQFISQSKNCYIYGKDVREIDTTNLPDTNLAVVDDVADDELGLIQLAGVHNRQNAYLVWLELIRMGVGKNAALEAINSFPGTGRRFEKIADNLYSDYGHHPVEIKATLQMARELADEVVLVYQPHQNIRQHEIKDEYTDCMELAEKIYWLPTYLTREDPNLAVLTPQQLTQSLTNSWAVEYAELDEDLATKIAAERAAGRLVLCMGAGTIDGWVRANN